MEPPLTPEAFSGRSLVEGKVQRFHGGKTVCYRSPVPINPPTPPDMQRSENFQSLLFDTHCIKSRNHLDCKEFNPSLEPDGNEDNLSEAFSSQHGDSLANLINDAPKENLDCAAQTATDCKAKNISEVDNRTITGTRLENLPKEIRQNIIRLSLGDACHRMIYLCNAEVVALVSFVLASDVRYLVERAKVLRRHYCAKMHDLHSKETSFSQSNYWQQPKECLMTLVSAPFDHVLTNLAQNKHSIKLTLGERTGRLEIQQWLLKAWEARMREGNAFQNWNIDIDIPKSAADLTEVVSQTEILLRRIPEDVGKTTLAISRTHSQPISYQSRKVAHTASEIGNASLLKIAWHTQNLGTELKTFYEAKQGLVRVFHPTVHLLSSEMMTGQVILNNFKSEKIESSRHDSGLARAFAVTAKFDTAVSLEANCVQGDTRTPHCGSNVVRRCRRDVAKLRVMIEDMRASWQNSKGDRHDQHSQPNEDSIMEQQNSQELQFSDNGSPRKKKDFKAKAEDVETEKIEKVGTQFRADTVVQFDKLLSGRKRESSKKVMLNAQPIPSDEMGLSTLEPTPDDVVIWLRLLLYLWLMGLTIANQSQANKFRN